jgi:hypothetical protein
VGLTLEPHSTRTGRRVCWNRGRCGTCKLIKNRGAPPIIPLFRDLLFVISSLRRASRECVVLLLLQCRPYAKRSVLRRER